MADDVPLSSLADRIALSKQELSSFVATEILKLFKWSVSSTVVITSFLVFVDTASLWMGYIKPDQRLITEKVILALIGASVVQVGAASAAIAYGLFRTPTPDKEAEPEGDG